MNSKLAFVPAVAAALALALPGSALAHDHKDRGHGRGHDRSDVPSRVSAPLKRTIRSLNRAEERIEDGETDKAVSTLTATRRNLSAALKAAKRRLTTDAGPDSAVAVAMVQHRVVDAVGGLYADQDGAVVEALNTTLKAAIDSRDALGTAVTALGEDDAADYEDFFLVVAESTEDELATIAEIREDDTVAPAGASVLEQAAGHITATLQAAEARLAALDAAADAELADEDEDEDEDAFDGETEDDHPVARRGRHGSDD